jgi:RimJ/RimL family protein N-acetyltransferase
MGWAEGADVIELKVRPMGVEDLDVRVRYFQEATDEHLRLLGVDREKLHTLDAWARSFEECLTRPVETRTDHGLIWEADGEPIGFSTADRIVFGDSAYMHLHLLHSEHRRKGYGAALVRRSTRTYVELFELKRLFCEPHAFNLAPNRAVQAAGFRYVSTQWTTPSPLNIEQVTNLWVFQPAAASRGGRPRERGR